MVTTEENFLCYGYPPLLLSRNNRSRVFALSPEQHELFFLLLLLYTCSIESAASNACPNTSSNKTFHSTFPTRTSNTSLPGLIFSISTTASKFPSCTTVYSGHILPSRACRSQCILNSWICSLTSAFLCWLMGSAQLGEALIVRVTRALRDFRLGRGEVGRRMSSWRDEGPRRIRRGRGVDILVVVVWLDLIDS